ncbi:hypothetical protein OS493_034053 [Desmophyllum pertusum]|uniref:Ankyrin repeat domain-containing protein 50 n=1 Tax=Desmophyllum pertusum TaxID=174260 RepID=A0A9X0CQU3_9CNID|nr:hypothetical protein OS493_034053 [Desmophyllum pertusum]
MASSSTTGTVGQLTKPEYRNWLALGHALTTELCQGLRPFITREMETFYRNVSARIGGPCTCVHVPRRKPNEYHDMSTCAWANIFHTHHHRNKPNWRQSDPAKWIDPILGPWEIAKLFLPDLGAGHAGIKSADDMDITGILNLMYWCTHFTIPQPLINDVRETRNNKWVHVPNLALTDADKKVAFDAIENLLKDPNIAHDADAQQALKKIGNLKCVSDLHSMEARVLADFKEVIGKELSNINTGLKTLTEESIRNKEQQSQLKEQQEIFKKQLDDLNRQRKRVRNKFWSSLFGNLARNVKSIRKSHVVAWLMLLLLCRFYVILDDSFNRDGCSIQAYSDPWELKYFDFSDFINSSRTEFIGRQWLYQEMESVLEHTSKRGVLITGNPGSGKSAFLSNLLCSRTSSPIIHNRILGYHFCMHFDKGTQNGAKFVRNLANMVAWKVIKYREVILTDSFVRRVLYKDCPQDPEWCFEQGILTPLKKLQQQPMEPWYVVIDALDECTNDKAEIFNMVKSKLPRLPKWLKLIVSSRNVSTITASLDGLQKVELRSDDERNRDDIDTYLSLKVFSLKESIVHRIKTALEITDNEAPTQKIVSSLAEKSQGNFQFVKVVLDLWLVSTNIVRDTFPKTLDSSYQLYFERKYSTPESFQSLRQIFEVLVAAYTPLTVNEMHSLFRIDHPTLDLEYELMPKLDQVSLFLWHGSGDGLIRIYHASLTEWLTSENNIGKFYYIKKQNGHKRLARYYLQNAEQNHSPLKPDEAFHLASHIVEGGLAEVMVQQFLSLPSDHINTTDPVTQTTALHHSSHSSDANVTKLLVHHFSNVDCVDNDQRTPSFIAATSGHLNNLEILFERGANLNHTAAYLDVEIASHSQDPISECKRKSCEYSLLHTASQEGNIDVVKFLIRHKVNMLRTTGTNNTAVQLAAENGHLETVQTLKRVGGVLDDISLHHAAAGGHIHVVQYLLREGIKDSCIHNLPSCMISDQDSELKTTKVRFYDNRHLYLRETALHAAVGRGHLPVITSLLREDQNALHCPNSAGRRPLHEAVHANNYNTLELLLASGANVNVQCKMSPSSIKAFIPVKFVQTHCPCGLTSLHIAALHGYHSTAKLLIKYKADVNATDCNGSSPLHLASCQNMPSLVALLINSGADINARSLNGSTPLHSAAVCFAKDVFRPLLDLGCDHLATDSEGLTALHYVVKDVTYVGFEYFVDLYVSNPKSWIENPITTSQQEIMRELDLQYPWLNSLIKLIKSSARTEKIRNTSFKFLHMIDKRNRSVFDTLEKKTNTSFLLTGSNSMGGSLLVLSLTPFIFAYDISFSETIKSYVVALNKPYELALIPRSFTRALSRTFTSLFTKLNCSTLLHCVSLNLVHAVNTVLQAGVDVNCRDVSGLTPLLVYLHTGGRHMSKVLVKHNVEVEITCGDNFENSVFHLASYHKLHYLHYLYEFVLGSDNWQKYLQTENAIFDYFVDRYDDKNNKGNVKTIRTGDGPLASAILSHPNGSNVIDECFDAEGYNAFHRAAQGANLVAIQKFLSWGANPLLQTTDGFSTLWLSILYAVKYRPYLNLDRPSALTSLEVELATFSASAILDHLLRNGTMDIGCNKDRSDLTLYHVAASRGMWQFIAHLFSTSRIIGIDVNCPNKDGITPMYLAYFIGGDSCEWHSPWCKVIDVIKSYGGRLQYPTLEAEYFLIFNIFFGRNPSPLFLDLTEDEILTLQEGCGRDECREYKTRNVDLFRKSDEIDRVHIDYQKKIDKCSTFIEDCPADIKTGLLHFTFVVFRLDHQQALKFNFFHMRNSFVTFLDSEIERLKKLLFSATRPHAEIPCVLKQPEKIDMCSQFHKQDLETVLHKWYRNYKESLDLVVEKSDEVKSSMPVNGKLPRFLAKMNFALTNYDTTLSCDWQAVAIKYIQLSFHVRNLNFWVQAVHETLTVPSVSDFLSNRMINAILQHSEESLQLVLKLASGKPSETFNYLRILRFQKPPMWRETFSSFGNFGSRLWE